MDMNMALGARLLESPYLTVPGKPYEERFYWPWKPWTKTRTVVPQVPDPTVYTFDGGQSFVGHPETIRELRRQLRVIEEKEANRQERWR